MDGEAGGSGAPLTAAHAPGLRGEPATRKGRQRDPPGQHRDPPAPTGGREGREAAPWGIPPPQEGSGGVVHKQPGRRGAPPAWNGAGGGLGGVWAERGGLCSGALGRGRSTGPPRVGRGGGSRGGGGQGKGGVPSAGTPGVAGSAGDTQTLQRVPEPAGTPPPRAAHPPSPALEAPGSALAVV